MSRLENIYDDDDDDDDEILRTIYITIIWAVLKLIELYWSLLRSIEAYDRYWHWLGELTGGRDESKDEFPRQREEVHDVVSAGRHLLLALLTLFSLLVVI